MTQTRQWTDDVADQVQERLMDSDLALKSKRLTVSEVTNAIGEDSWRLLLWLPAPAGETWDQQQVYQLRRRAIDIFDDLADEADRVLTGQTIAFVTTDEAADDEIATDDPPEPGEELGLPR